MCQGGGVSAESGAEDIKAAQRAKPPRAGAHSDLLAVLPQMELPTAQWPAVKAWPSNELADEVLSALRAALVVAGSEMPDGDVDAEAEEEVRRLGQGMNGEPSATADIETKHASPCSPWTTALIPSHGSQEEAAEAALRRRLSLSASMQPGQGCNLTSSRSRSSA